MRSALSAKLEENSLLVVDSFALETCKTKDFLKILRGLGGVGKVLLVNADQNNNLSLSSRNLPNVKLVASSGVNIHDVVNSEQLVFSKEAILRLQEVLSR